MVGAHQPDVGGSSLILSEAAGWRRSELGEPLSWADLIALADPRCAWVWRDVGTVARRKRAVCEACVRPHLGESVE